MADLVDVETSIVSLISQTLYPNGTGASSLTGPPVVVYPGWPTASRLDADLAAGKLHVTVFPGKTERNTTRYEDAWVQTVAPITTLTLTVSGREVLISGTVYSPQNVMLMVNGVAYIYGVKPTDTLASIAAALAAEIPGASSQSYSATHLDSQSPYRFKTQSGVHIDTQGGAAVILPATAILQAYAVGGVGQAIKEIRRQERLFQITIWADTPAHRDPVSKAIDSAFANLQWIQFPEGTAGRLIYRSTLVDDMAQKALLYRRDLFYTVEYPTIQTLSLPEILAVDTTISFSVVLVGLETQGGALILSQGGSNLHIQSPGVTVYNAGQYLPALENVT